jgi:hypothetical protein
LSQTSVPDSAPRTREPIESMPISVCLSVMDASSGASLNPPGAPAGP